MTKSEKIAQINAKLTADIAAVKAQKEQTIADYYAKVAELQRAACEAKNAATDDDQKDEPQELREAVYNEPEEPQDCDQPTLWLNGEQWSCAVVARRILNKLPKLNSPKESFYIEISPSYFGGCGLSFRYINTIDKPGGVTSCELLAKDGPEELAQKIDLWLKEVEVQMAKAQEIMRKEAENE